MICYAIVVKGEDPALMRICEADPIDMVRSSHPISLLFDHLSGAHARPPARLHGSPRRESRSS